MTVARGAAFGALALGFGTGDYPHVTATPPSR
jgi:homoaconitase/3-isopropylmalate dehydratase large subunit